MPQTLKHTIDRAASKAKIKESGIDLSTQDYSDFTSELNAFMFENAASGINIGWAEITDLNAYISTPMWADLYVQNSLAMHMVAEFGIPSPPELQAAFERSERAIEKQLIDVPVAPFPNILPTGYKGIANGDVTNHFFVDQEAGSITDNLGAPLTDDGGVVIYEQ